MPKEITKGWTVDEATERIMSKGAELSAKPGQVSISLVFKKIGSSSVPHLLFKESGSAAVLFELDSKIPPSTGIKKRSARKKK